jgi:hypothetical protein
MWTRPPYRLAEHDGEIKSWEVDVKVQFVGLGRLGLFRHSQLYISSDRWKTTTHGMDFLYLSKCKLVQPVHPRQVTSLMLLYKL